MSTTTPVLRVEPAHRPGVLVIGNFLSASGGTLDVCEELAAQLRAAHWRVLTASDKPNCAHRLLDMLATIWRERRFYRVAQIDVYHGRAFVWAEAACALLRLLDKPYVLTLHGGRLPYFAARWPRRVRRLLASAPVVTVPSRYFAAKMQSYRQDLRVLPNALALGAYEFRLRREPKPDLVWLRAFREVYNPCLAVQVLAELAKEFPATRLKMIGPDKGDRSQQRTEQLAGVLGVADRLTLPGAVGKAGVPAALQGGDIFLNSTNVDNTPVSVIEALACGLCVVSTDVGGLPWLLEHEQDALLVPPDNQAAMAAAVRRLLRDEALAERLSRNARAKAEQHAWSVVLPQWEAILTSLGTGRGPKAVTTRSASGMDRKAA